MDVRVFSYRADNAVSSALIFGILSAAARSTIGVRVITMLCSQPSVNFVVKLVKTHQSDLGHACGLSSQRIYSTHA